MFVELYDINSMESPVLLCKLTPIKRSYCFIKILTSISTSVDNESLTNHDNFNLNHGKCPCDCWFARQQIKIQRYVRWRDGFYLKKYLWERTSLCEWRRFLLQLSRCRHLCHLTMQVSASCRREPELPVDRNWIQRVIIASHYNHCSTISGPEILVACKLSTARRSRSYGNVKNSFDEGPISLYAAFRSNHSPFGVIDLTGSGVTAATSCFVSCNSF
jgi:hypothetical protein